MRAAFRVTLAVIALAAGSAHAVLYPYAGTSLRAGFELVDVARVGNAGAGPPTMSVAYDHPERRLRYSTRSPDGSSGMTTTVVSLSNATRTRFTFAGDWSNTCQTLEPAVSGPDFVAAVAAVMAAGEAASYPTVVSVLATVPGHVVSRGATATRFTATNATFPVNGLDCTGAVSWDLAEQWPVDRVDRPLVRFAFAGQCGGNASAQAVDLVGNVMWFVTATPDPVLFKALGTCNATQPASVAQTAVTLAPEPALLFPMPTLPNEFSALVHTSLLERGVTLNLYESYSWAHQAARSTYVFPDQSKSIVVSGRVGLAYLLDSTRGLRSMITEPVAADGTFTTRFHFPEVAGTSCAKGVFNMQLVGNVNDLLLRSLAASPRYLGRILVRDIPAVYWRASTAAYDVTWYFRDAAPPTYETFAPPTTTRAPPTTSAPPTTPAPANASGTLSPNASTAPNATTSAGAPKTARRAAVQPLRRRFTAEAVTAGRLLRITVVGSGKSPFFTLHPFLQRGMPLPTNQRAACLAALPDSPEDCEENLGEFFHHVYDFASFVPRADAAEVVVPDLCTQDGAATIETYPEAQNCPTVKDNLSSGLGTLMIVLALLASVILVIACGCLIMRAGRERAERKAQAAANLSP